MATLPPNESGHTATGQLAEGAATSTTNHHGRHWTLTPNLGLSGLTFHTPSPPSLDPAQIPLSPTQVLVRLHFASLNYRDIAMTLGTYPLTNRSSTIPCSDASGTILRVGAGVTRFAPGDAVCTVFNQDHQRADRGVTAAQRASSLGSHRDGVLREFAVFEEEGVVRKPKHLGFAEAATLSCAALTAWNALMGLPGRLRIHKGEYVLVQGTGGVSLFAAQIAVAAGAVVIATTSGKEKEAKLRAMGVQHVIQRKEDPEWGSTAKRLTAGGEGVHHVLEVGGETSVAQSLKAVRCEGVISFIGFLGGKEEGPRLTSWGDLLPSLAIVRGIVVGSRELFEEMNLFLEEHGIHPVLDSRVFALEEAKEAYRYLIDQKQWGKIVIRISDP